MSVVKRVRALMLNSPPLVPCSHAVITSLAARPVGVLAARIQCKPPTATSLDQTTPKRSATRAQISQPRRHQHRTYSSHGVADHECGTNKTPPSPPPASSGQPCARNPSLPRDPLCAGTRLLFVLELGVSHSECVAPDSTRRVPQLHAPRVNAAGGAGLAFSTLPR